MTGSRTSGTDGLSGASEERVVWTSETGARTKVVLRPALSVDRVPLLFSNERYVQLYSLNSCRHARPPCANSVKQDIMYDSPIQTWRNLACAQDSDLGASA